MEKDNIRIQRWVVLVGVLLLLAKFTAYFLTHSNAILTDALESIVNVVAGAFALYSLSLAAIPRDANHPYGHGKVEFISATIEGVLIIVAGGVIVVKSFYTFFHPIVLEKLDIGIALVIFSGIVNYVMGAVIESRGKKKGSLTLVAGGKHLKSDAYSTAGLIVGLAIIYFTGMIWIDNIVGMGFGALIAYTGLKILRESVAGIMDEADFTLLEEVVKVLNANRRENWIDVHNMRIIKYGSLYHIDCHVTVPYYFKVREAHEEIDQMAKLIEEHFENQVEFFIHVDDCLPPDSCLICTKQDCAVRQQHLDKKVVWNLDNVMTNKKHHIK